MKDLKSYCKSDMEYEVNILDVGDADAIVINYDAFGNGHWVTAVIDAGNVGDGEKIKPYIKHREPGKYIIDHAFCTHPDKDHKGGFFDLLEDKNVDIRNFYLMDPYCSIILDKRLFYSYSTSDLKRIESIYNHPNDDSKNLISIITKKGIGHNVRQGFTLSDIHITIVGPTAEFFRGAVIEMFNNFVELKDEVGAEKYCEDEVLDDEEAKSVIDGVEELSATNKSSMILLFEPGDKKFLLAGDSCAASIRDAIQAYGSRVKNCILKVPHHGSKHNLNTKVIDLLEPTSAVISCKGSKKHPNSGIVYWLSKYCNVYSTHKSGNLTYFSRPGSNPAEPLRAKMK